MRASESGGVRLTEREVATWCYAVVKEGAAARVSGASCPFPAKQELRSMLHSIGWVQEDLRQALMKADPVYRANQEAFEKCR